MYTYFLTNLNVDAYSLEPHMSDPYLEGKNRRISYSVLYLDYFFRIPRLLLVT